jgi:hypothetical protein
MRNAPSQAEIEFLELLSSDEFIGIFDKRGTLQWCGVVEEVAADLGVAWLRTDMGERRMLDIRGQHIRRLQWPLPGQAVPLP